MKNRKFIIRFRKNYLNIILEYNIPVRMPYTKKASEKYFETHREEWNEYTRNYARNKYQNDPVFREKEKARQNAANQRRKLLREADAAQPKPETQIRKEEIPEL